MSGKHRATVDDGSLPIKKKRKWVKRTFLSLLGVGLVITTVFGVQVVQRMQQHNEDAMTAAATIARANGFGSLVATAENIYYGYIHVAPVGGDPTEQAAFDGGVINSPTATPLATLPPVANIPQWGAASLPHDVPDVVVSPVKKTTSGEGEWVGTKVKVNGTTAIRIARIRPDTQHTSVYATMVWFDSSLLGFQLISGYSSPSGNFNHGDGKVSKKLKPFYVAGFNSAFLMADSQGGFVYNGKNVSKLRRGKATLVTYPDGHVDVIKYGRDVIGNYTSARQNLNLIVDGGVSMVKNENQAQWGWAWHGVGNDGNLVWRSAVGVRADGTVVYVVGQVLSAQSLADMMVRAGAVRAMALDMNSGYANGYLYGPYLKGNQGKKFDPDIPVDSSRFFNASERDFVAVFMKSPADSVKR
jgi:hypothetical protein